MESSVRIAPRQSCVIPLVVFANLFLVVLYVVPETNRLVDRGFRALEAMGLATIVGVGLQLWVVGSTLFATGLLLWRLAKKRRITPGGSATPDGTTLDSILLLAWWLTLIGICMYAFMLGMAG